MPEILTKDPALALEVLRNEGIECGVGITPKILTSCPQDRFCMLRGDEVCVYGARELALMTELTREDVCGPLPDHTSSSGFAGPAVGIGAAVGAVLGFAFVRTRRWRHEERR